MLIFEKCRIRCAGNLCPRAILHLNPLYMMLFGHLWWWNDMWNHSINISIQFVADFRPHWPKARSLWWPLVKVNGVMLKFLQHPKCPLGRFNLSFRIMAFYTAKYDENTTFLQAMHINVKWRHITSSQLHNTFWTMAAEWCRQSFTNRTNVFILEGCLNWYLCSIAAWHSWHWP